MQPGGMHSPHYRGARRGPFVLGLRPQEDVPDHVEHKCRRREAGAAMPGGDLASTHAIMAHRLGAVGKTSVADPTAAVSLALPEIAAEGRAGAFTKAMATWPVHPASMCSILQRGGKYLALLNIQCQAHVTCAGCPVVPRIQALPLL